MKQLLSISFLLFVGLCQAQDELYFPPTNGDPWESLTPAEIGWCEDGLDTLVSFLDSRDTKAFILLYQGKIVVEEYFDDFTADSLWVWNSAGKTITATAVGVALQEGLLDLEDPTSNYLGDGWTNMELSQEQNITILNQLTMTTGLDDQGDVYCTDPECLNYLAEPGERWAYHNAPYTLLDGVISEASGQTLNIFTFTRILQPCGMLGLFYPFDYNNVFISRPRDMARFGLLMLNSGVWDGNPILTDPNYFNAMVNPSQDLNKSYGYLWWLNGYESYRIPSLQIDFPGPLFPNAPQDLYAALGKDSQIIHVVPSEDIVLIRMGLSPDNSPVQLQFNIDLWNVLDFLLCENPNTVEESSMPALSMYPNPASSELTISGVSGAFHWVVYDLAGRQMMNGTGNSVPTDRLPAGCYVLTCKTENTTVSKQFMVE